VRKITRIVPLLVLAWIVLLSLPEISKAQQPPPPAGNQVMGEVRFDGAGKTEKTSGVWIDGQYVGFVNELKGDKKILLLPGEHEIAVKQNGYQDFVQKVVVEPGQVQTLRIKMERDPRVKYAQANAEVKIVVEPDRAAVFVDNTFAGHAHEFGGVGRAMLIPPGKHRIRIALPGYQDFVTEVELKPGQKFEIKTELAKGSIESAGPEIKPGN
jgi:PEGA domain